MWATHTSAKRIRRYERDLRFAIDTYPWSDAYGPKFESNHCSVCLFRSQHGLETESQDSDCESRSEQPPVAKKVASRRTRAVEKQSATVIGVGTNDLRSKSPVERSPLKLDFTTLTQPQAASVQKKIDHYRNTGGISATETVPNIGQKILDQLAAMEQSLSGQIRSIHVMMGRIENRIKALESRSIPGGSLMHCFGSGWVGL